MITDMMHLLTPSEVCRIIGVSHKTVHGWTAGGILSAVKTKLGYLYNPTDIEEFRLEREANLAVRTGPGGKW